jgi:hypothetical protein
MTQTTLPLACVAGIPMVRGHFEWQTGYGAFSYGQSQVEAVKAYIANQPDHHRKQLFKDEYRAFLNCFLCGL